jgi:glycosyltransferase involved in cell wall biosynthesis
MNIGIVTELFPPKSIGGAEMSAYYLSRGLAKAGHNVVVITPNYGRKTMVEERDGFKLYMFGFPDVVKTQLSSRVMANPLIYTLFAWNVRKAVKQFKLEILHAQNNFTLIPTYFSSQGTRKFATLRDYGSFCDCGYCPFGTFREHSFPGYIRQKYRWQPSIARLPLYFYDYVNLRMKQYVLGKMNGTVSISRFVKNVYKKIGIDSEVVYNPAPEIKGILEKEKARKRLGLDGSIVSFVGKLSKGKGIQDFLKVAERLPDVNFIVVGDGPMKREVEGFSKKSGNLKYLGRLPHGKALQVMKASDVVAMLSVWSEPLGRIPIEAFKLGTPCISTNSGALPETIKDGYNGFLVNPGDTETIVKRIKQLLSDKKLREEFVRNGKATIMEQFDTDRIVKRHEELYSRYL